MGMSKADLRELIDYTLERQRIASHFGDEFKFTALSEELDTLMSELRTKMEAENPNMVYFTVG